MSKSRNALIFIAAIFLIAVLMLPVRSAQAEENKELIFGMSAAFTGANGEMGIEFYRGLMAYLEYFNANGGADGWKINVKPANDGYNPIPCFQNTVKFVEEDVFALFSYVGTPTTTHILPLLQKFHKRETFLLFPLTGAQPLRTAPFGQYVYNLRASYFEETAGLVDHLINVGRDRIAVFYQSDAYGRTGWDGVRRAMKDHDLSVVGEVAYQRGAPFDRDFTEEAELLMASNPDAIICIGTYASQGALIRDLRNRGYTLPVAGLSFADSDKMLQLLMEQGRKDKRVYTENLINSQVVPCYEDIELEGVRLYRELMESYTGLPTLTSQNYTPRRFSYVSFEGFLNGMLLGEIIRRMADDPRRERIPEVIESIRDFDLGIGFKVDFSGGRHQGLHNVYYTTVRDERFLPIEDWQRWRR